MTGKMMAFLMSRYRMDAETAAELVAELKDIKSLRALAGYRSVPGSAVPNDLEGLQ